MRLELVSRWRPALAVLAAIVVAGVTVAVVLVRGWSEGGPSDVPAAMEAAGGSAAAPAEISPPPAGATPLPVINNPARLPTRHADTLDSLVGEYPFVFVGTVVATEPKEIPDSGGTSEVYTLATVRADRWVSRAPAGLERELVVVQHGGVWRGRVVITYGGDAIMQPGEQYLFFLRAPEGAMGLVGSPFGRFPLGGGRLGLVKEEFADLGAVKALRGLMPDEAVARINAALLRNGLPAAE